MAEGGPDPASEAGSSRPGDSRSGNDAAPPDRAESQERLGSQSDLLTEMKVLRRRARSARHAYWFPLVLFGLLTCASVPFYIHPVPRETGAFTIRPVGPPLPLLGDYPGLPQQRYLAYYWIAALLGGLLLTQLWYLWHARQVGLATPARAYLVVAVVFTVAAIVIPLLPGLPVIWPGALLIRGTFPFLTIAVGLLALAWAERSRALAIIASVYAGTTLLAILYDVSNILYLFGWNTSAADQLLPNVLLPAAVLLLAGAGTFAVQRRHRTAA